MLYLNDTFSTYFNQLEQATVCLLENASVNYLIESERIHQAYLFTKKQKFAELERKHYAGIKKLFK